MESLSCRYIVIESAEQETGLGVEGYGHLEGG
jgi:hypothetical protein